MHLNLLLSQHMSDDDNNTALKIAKEERYPAQQPEIEQALREAQNNPTKFALDVTMGAFTLGKKEAFLSVGRVLQSVSRGEGIRRFAEEVKRLQEIGELPKNLYDTTDGFRSFADVIECLERKDVDEDQLRAIVAMFYSALQCGSKAGDVFVTRRLLQLSLELTPSQIALISAARSHKFDGTNQDTAHVKHNLWVERMCEELGHNITSLVEEDETTLVDKKLFSRQHQRSELVSKQRLTDMGVRFCDHLESFEQLHNKR
jgi:hypothetical protein